MSIARSHLALAMAVSVWLWSPLASRAQCEVGFRPGATLLFPYFEVDPTNPNGLTTLISINNSSTDPVLTRVVVWTDWAQPVLSFDLFLKGNDVQTMNLRDLFNGLVPSTGAGELVSYVGCVEHPPAYPAPALDHAHVEQLIAALTGGSALSDYCYAERYEDKHPRGYITVDTVDQCHGLSDSYYYSRFTPADPSYIDHLTVQNVLWGDMIYVDPAGNSAQGVEAVAIHADEGLLLGPVKNTFYGRYVAWSGRDKRSPLPTQWTTRFLNGGAFSGGTDVIVFRDTLANAGANCGDEPYWYPLMSAGMTARDEDGRKVLDVHSNPFFPLATQRVNIASLLGSGFDVPFGQLELALRTPEGRAAGAWVIPVMTASGRYSVDFNGQPLDTGCGRSPF